jgi:DUF438 domain-containing protein
MPGKSKEISTNDSMEELTNAINNLTNLFKEAAKEIKSEEKPESSELGKKLDVLIRQNEDIARALLLLLELNREHLPNISKHVKRSADAMKAGAASSHPGIYQSPGYRLPGTAPPPHP